MEFGANHRRVLSIRFSELEGRLEKIRRLLSEQPTESVFNKCVDDISDEERSRLSKLLSDIRRELQEMNATLCLDPSIQSTRGLLQSLLAFSWSDLQDIRPEKLGGYGPVSREGASFLSPHVDRLTGLVLAMSSVLSHDRRSDEVDGAEGHDDDCLPHSGR